MYTICKEIFLNTDIYIGKDIKIGGWIRTSRNNKNIGFIELNDGSFFKSVQVVYENLTNGLSFDETSKLGVGACITVHGKVIESIGAKQSFEIKAESIILEGACPNTYPLQKKRHSNEFLRTIAHLRPRTNTFSAVFRVRSIASHAIHTFFQELGFVYVNTPILTGSDGEGGSDMFTVTTLSPKEAGEYNKDFFGKKTHHSLYWGIIPLVFDNSGFR